MRVKIKKKSQTQGDKREIPWQAINAVAKDVSEYLEKNCPYFITDNKCGGSVWHHCTCSDLPRKVTTNLPMNLPEYKSCACVHHTTGTCHRGRWPQLEQKLNRKFAIFAEWQKENPLPLLANKQDIMDGLPETISS